MKMCSIPVLFQVHVQSLQPDAAVKDAPPPPAYRSADSVLTQSFRIPGGIEMANKNNGLKQPLLSTTSASSANGTGGVNRGRDTVQVHHTFSPKDNYAHQPSPH